MRRRIENPVEHLRWSSIADVWLSSKYALISAKIIKIGTFITNLTTWLLLLSLRLEGEKTLKYCCVCWPSCMNDHDARTSAMFLLSTRKFPFWGHLVKKKKNQNYQFKLKFGIYTNSSMQNLIVVFILFVSDWKYLFWTNSVQKIIIVSLSWNLGPILIRICIIQWRCSLFLF